MPRASRRKPARRCPLSSCTARGCGCGLHGEDFSWRDGPDGTMIFDRGNLTVAVNFAAPELELPDGELVLASEPDVTTTLPADTAAWVRRNA